MNTDRTTLPPLAGADYPSDPHAPARMILAKRASIRVSGTEAGAFLQAILTQEILTRTSSSAVHAALCNAKGRTLSTLLVHPVHTGAEQEYRLSVPASLTSELVKTLKLYMLRRHVSLSLETDWGVMGVINPPSSLLKDLGFTCLPPRPLDQCITADGLIATWEQRSEGPRLSLQGPTDALSRYGESMSSSMEIVDERAWEQAEILDGIAQITPETYLHFVPQWLNLDLKDGISFKKGCYPGQEVIARLHYLGKPNRRLQIGLCAHPAPLRPGTAIGLQDDASVDAGEIVSSVTQAPATGGGQLFLAVMRLKHIHDALAIDGAPCKLHPGAITHEIRTEGEETQTH